MPKQSPINKISASEFGALIERSSSITEILAYFGLRNRGSNHVTLKRRIEKEKINWDHIPQGLLHRKGRPLPYKGKIIPLKDVLVRNSKYSRCSLKRRLLGDGILKNECSECGLTPTWNNRPLSLQIDHINGIKDDNRLANLRILCPNCHSQTDTFAAKNRIEE